MPGGTTSAPSCCPAKKTRRSLLHRMNTKTYRYLLTHLAGRMPRAPPAARQVTGVSRSSCCQRLWRQLR